MRILILPLPMEKAYSKIHRRPGRIGRGGFICRFCDVVQNNSIGVGVKGFCIVCSN